MTRKLYGNSSIVRSTRFEFEKEQYCLNPSEQDLKPFVTVGKCVFLLNVGINAKFIQWST